jgi:uncharacterized protein YggU (UPF0235/DUF167 family)
MPELTSQLKLRVIPRAKRTGWGGRRGEAWVVRLQAAPVKGAANAALLDFLHEALGVPGSALEILSGEQSRDKLVRVHGLSQAELEKRVDQSSA